MPIKNGVVDTYVLNNVYDRVVNPVRASKEAGRIVNSDGCFVLSNCDPLQYEYQTDSGETIIWVPEKNQISLEQGLEVAGFMKVAEKKGDWNIETAAYGKEKLPYKSLAGVRK